MPQLIANLRFWPTLLSHLLGKTYHYLVAIRNALRTAHIQFYLRKTIMQQIFTHQHHLVVSTPLSAQGQRLRVTIQFAPNRNRKNAISQSHFRFALYLQSSFDAEIGKIGIRMSGKDHSLPHLLYFSLQTYTVPQPFCFFQITEKQQGTIPHGQDRQFLVIGQLFSQILKEMQIGLCFDLRDDEGGYVVKGVGKFVVRNIGLDWSDPRPSRLDPSHKFLIY